MWRFAWKRFWRKRDECVTSRARHNVKLPFDFGFNKSLFAIACVSFCSRQSGYNVILSSICHGLRVIKWDMKFVFFFFLKQNGLTCTHRLSHGDLHTSVNQFFLINFSMRTICKTLILILHFCEFQ